MKEVKRREPEMAISGATLGFPKHQQTQQRSGNMKDLFTKVKQFVRAQEGASAVEYGLLVAGIAVVVMVSIYLIGTNLNAKFDSVAQKLGE